MTTTTLDRPAVKATTADRILDLFRDVDTADVKEIMVVTGLSRSTVNDNLRKLANSGDMIRMDIDGVAKWSLTPTRKAANKKAAAKIAAAAARAAKAATPKIAVDLTAKTPTGRRAKGVLDAQILVWLTERATEMYGPYDVAKGVDAKTGAVHPALERLLRQGLVTKPQAERPVRYQAQTGMSADEVRLRLERQAV